MTAVATLLRDCGEAWYLNMLTQKMQHCFDPVQHLSDVVRSSGKR
jgi:hypothetical protein